MNILFLLALFLIKHFLADFPLQSQWMVFGKGKEKGWILPLAAHASVHGILTTLIIFAATFDLVLALLIGGLEAVAHFSIDRVKASPNLLGRFKDISKPSFWIALGADQLAHNLCYLLIVYSVKNYL